MNATLYVKPNIIGLQFSEPKDRDLFWTLLGENRNCAEMFGKLSIRLNPARAKKLFQVPLYTDKIQVIEEQPPQAPAKAAPAPVPVTALKAPEPIAAIGSLPPEVTGEVVAAPPVVETPVVVTPKPVPIPQVGSVGEMSLGQFQQAVDAAIAMPDKDDYFKAAKPDPEPPDKRTKEWKQWKSRQK